MICPPRADAQWYYAAPDVYVGPTLKYTFAQPPTEAMTRGLPVITMATNGKAEIMTDGVDGLILQDPSDVGASPIEFVGSMSILQRGGTSPHGPQLPPANIPGTATAPRCAPFSQARWIAAAAKPILLRHKKT
jgi:hypothetical protein